jgi:hypothetical protein
METFTIYGLRVQGDREVRYVGQTHDAVERRAAAHVSRRSDLRRSSLYSEWADANHGRIEGFAIATAPTREEAKRLEQVVIGFCLKLNHRLFNYEHVPPQLRFPHHSQDARPNLRQRPIEELSA